MNKLCLFSGFGVELEYMIVERESLNILPIADKLIYEMAGSFQHEIIHGKVAWSNELVLHVIELKTNGPAAALTPLARYFQQEIQLINSMLTKYQAKLLPTGAHPWMEPLTQTSLWPHGDNTIYNTYHEIFNCCGHGWSNLQSVHLNLPFANDDEFARLHTAIRLLLPIIPALCASTPIIEGRLSGYVDTRLEFYRHNQQKIPTISGEIIPERVLSQKEYESKILRKMYDEIASYDPSGVLQEEWLNSRGAIARFDRSTIEIRIMDTQEHPGVDLAILALVVTVLKCLVSEKWQSFELQQNWPESRLKEIFIECIKYGMKARIFDSDYLAVFGLAGAQMTLQDLWQLLLFDAQNALTSYDFNLLAKIMQHGNLAERILDSLPENNITQAHIQKSYQKLSDCLQTGTLYLPL
jgi:glutamate---cysteine ligase / carboxylate-amine ligase